MKNILIKIVVLLISFSMFAIYCYGAQENTTENKVVEERTVQEKPTETKKNETMYVQERCNIRSSYSVDSDRVGGLDVGTEVNVVAEYSNGWYKIKYNGGEAYIKSGILKTTKPEIEEAENVEEETEQENTDNTQTTQNITTLEKTEENSDSNSEDEKLKQEIGVLPEVGHNLADALFLGIIIFSLGVIIFIKYKK